MPIAPVIDNARAIKKMIGNAYMFSFFKRSNLDEEVETGERPQLVTGLPSDIVIYAIGDIHGRDDLLKGIHDIIDSDRQRASGDKKSVEIYVGDYVDRGPNSREVVDRLIDRNKLHNCHFVRGNHEVLFMRYLDGSLPLSAWKKCGGIPTIVSYGITSVSTAGSQSESHIQTQFRAKIPKNHIEFLRSTIPYCVAGDLLFVHAGIRPGVPLERQSEDDLFWIRREFLSSTKDLGHIVVHGHSPVSEVEFKRNRINIDTGAFTSGKLTCLRLDQQGAQVLD